MQDRIETAVGDLASSPMPRTVARPSGGKAPSAPSDDGIFPLRLTPFEEYMYVDDDPAYPAVGFIGLLFRGHFERAALAAAFGKTLARHPLLQAHVERAGKRLQWMPTTGAEQVLRWVPSDGPLAVPGAWPIDLDHEAGLRIFLRESGEHTEMLCQVHHSASDAIGVSSFVTDMLDAYAQSVLPGSPTVARPPLDPSRLPDRGRFGMTVGAWVRRFPKDAAASLAALEFLGHRPVAVESPSDGRALAEPVFPTVAAHAFTEEETARVRRLKKEMGCTVNDLLIAALLVTLYRWNLRHAPDTRKRVMRIMVPMSLRAAEDETMTAANIVSYVYMEMRPHRVASPRALIRRVRFEMGICKRWKSGLTFVQAIRIARRLPGGLARMLPKDRCMATAVLSNIGDLARNITLPERDGRLTAGNVALERCDVLPPVRPMTSASFGVNVYAGRLCLAVHCDPYRFTPADAADLLSAYARQITAFVDDPDWLESPDGDD